SKATGGITIALGVIWSAAIYLLARRSHGKWRVFDLEFARRLQATGRWNIFRAPVINRRFAPVIAAQIARDLQLTVRAFSSAVYVVLGISALWIIAMIVVLTTGLLPPPAVGTGWLDATWLPTALAIKAVCALVAVSLAAL